MLLQDCCARLLELAVLSVALRRRPDAQLQYLLLCPFVVCAVMLSSSAAISLAKVRLIRRSGYSSAVSIYLKMRR